MTRQEWVDQVLELSRLYQANRILTHDREAVRIVGETLNAAGGRDLMRYTLAIAAPRPQFNNPDGPHPAEIDCAWDGIGDWRY